MNFNLSIRLSDIIKVKLIRCYHIENVWKKLNTYACLCKKIDKYMFDMSDHFKYMYELALLEDILQYGTTRADKLLYSSLVKV